MGLTLFRCGRCGKRYANPLAHTCITRLDRKRPPGKTHIKPRASLKCGRCGKPYANPFTHTCAVKTDFRKRQAAEAKRKRAAARGGGGSRQGSGQTHDYRECFYHSQGDRHRAAEDCPRFPCRLYREGHEHGYADGHQAGYAEGYAAGYNTAARERR